MTFQLDDVRGVAAAIPRPASQQDLFQLHIQFHHVYEYNEDAHFRNPDNDQDIAEAVYRWDDRSPEEIFRTGFSPRPLGDQLPEDYYNLERHVNGGGAPAYTSLADGSVFVSTTRSTKWRPRVTASCILYRYEIFAPGGLDANLTLDARNQYQNQQEISFAGGISPQYIRIARPYAVVVDPDNPNFPYYTFLGHILYINSLCNPNPTLGGQTTPEFWKRLTTPRCPRGSQIVKYEPPAKKRDANDTQYVCRVGHYIESSFKKVYKRRKQRM